MCSNDGSHQNKSQPLFLPSHICLRQLAPVSRDAPLFLRVSPELGLETHPLVEFLFDAEAILLKLETHFGSRKCSLPDETMSGSNLMRLSRVSLQFVFCELGRHEFMQEDPNEEVLSGHNSRVVDLQHTLLTAVNSMSPNSPHLVDAIHFSTWAQRLFCFPELDNLQGYSGASLNLGVDMGSVLSLALQLQLADRANLALGRDISSQPFICCPDLLPMRFRAELPFFVVVEVRSEVGGLCGERALRLDEVVSVLTDCSKSKTDIIRYTRKHALHFLTWDSWMLTLEPRHRALLDPPLTPDMHQDLLAEMEMISSKTPSHMNRIWKASEPSKFQLWWRKWRELVLQGLQEAAGRLPSTQGTKQPEDPSLHVTPEHAGLEMLRAVDQFAYEVIDTEFDDLGEDIEEGMLGEGGTEEERDPWDFGPLDDLRGSGVSNLEHFQLLLARAAPMWREFSKSEWRENPFLDWQVSCRLGEVALMLGFDGLAALRTEVRERIGRGELGWDMDLGHPDTRS